MARVLVSLVTHNESRDTERLLPTLFAQTFRDFELVAVDNRSEDGTRASLAAAKKLAPVPMEIVASRENLGFTGGHNVGIGKAVERGAEWVLVLNADVILAPDYLETLLADALRPGREWVGALTGKILRADGPDLVPTHVVDTAGIRMTRSGRHFDVGAGEPDTGRWDRPAEVFGVSGCVALYRVAALEDVKIATGYFDDDFFVYREDVDLAWRLRGRGWTARCVPAALAWHRRRNLPSGAARCPPWRTSTRSRTASSCGSTTPAATTSGRPSRHLRARPRRRRRVPHRRADLPPRASLARAEPAAAPGEAARDPRRGARSPTARSCAGSAPDPGGARIPDLDA